MWILTILLAYEANDKRDASIHKQTVGINQLLGDNAIHGD